MKKHESRLLKEGEKYKLIPANGKNNLLTFPYRSNNFSFIYVDSKNRVHNLKDKATNHFNYRYWIHGKYYNKNEWEIEANRLLMLEEL